MCPFCHPLGFSGEAVSSRNSELLGLSVTLAKLDCATLLTCKIGVVSLFIMRDKNQLIHAKCLKQGLAWSKH